MIRILLASAAIENRPDREDIKDITNWTLIASGRNYEEALENLVEAANNEDFSVENNWLMIERED